MGAETNIPTTMREPGVPPVDLTLKVGCIASVMRNISIKDGLVKSARVQVVSLRPNVAQVRLLQQGAVRAHAPGTEQTNMPTFYLSCITFEFEPCSTNWTVKRRQFPLRLAYARASLWIARLFAHGQLSTRLSRVRSGSDVRILRSPNARGLPTSDVVYRVLLLPAEDGQTTIFIAEG
jgi:hypothetical protein